MEAVAVRRRTLLACLGVLLVVVGATAVGGLKHADVRTVVLTGVREVVVDVDAGAVVVQARAGFGVAVRTGRAWLWGEPTADHRLVDGVLTITGRCPEFEIGCTVEEELSVPYGIEVAVAVGAGGITVAGIDVPRLDLRAGEGDIEARDVSAAGFFARSGGGGVRVSLVRPPSEVRVEGAGDVDLTVPRGRYRVDAAAATGRTTVDVQQDPVAARLLFARSGAGDVTIRAGRP